MAASFRPCWELDDAPFTGPGTMSEGDVRDLHAGGVHPEVRPTHPSSSSYATNGAHAPPAPTPVPREPENSVIIDRSISAEPPPPPPSAAEPIAPPSFAPPPPAAAPAAVPPSARRQAVPALTQPAAHVRTAAVDFGVEDEFPRKSKKGLYAAIAVVALGGIGAVVWAASGGKETTAAPAPTVQKPAEDKISAIPPPPPETAVTPPPQPQPPPQVAVAAATAPPPQPAAVPPPQAATPAALPAAPSPAPHAAGGTKAPHEPRTAAPHPKAAGQTIVRDVPF